MEFSNYVKRELNAANSLLIYSQLKKIVTTLGERPEIPLAEVEKKISENSAQAFRSRHFKQIEQAVLISLLSLDHLTIDELDLLIEVSKWVGKQIQGLGLQMNDENRRNVFNPIKGYVVFSALKFEKLNQCKEICELLNDSELASLFRHLIVNQSLTIEQVTTRRARRAVTRR